MKHWTVAALAGCMLFAGCRTAGPSLTDAPRPADPRLAAVEATYAKGDYQGAISACIDLARVDPQMPGLADLQARVVAAITEERVKAARLRAENARAQMRADEAEGLTLPDTYGHRRTVAGATGSLRTPPGTMAKVLEKPVTVHLKDVDLDTFILAMGTDQELNIMADSSLSGLGSFTIHAEDTPLREILDYIARNLGITFAVGENLIWATAGATAQPGAPLETRLYRLRKGLISSELGGGGAADSGGGAAGPLEASVRVVDAIDRLVPKVDGSDQFFDSKAHVLLVRNTAENLALAERLIEELDVTPPQVLIEARFISTGVSDLRELGIDWVLNSPLVLSDKMLVAADGTAASVPRTVISSGGGITYVPAANAANGLNLSYRGILTDPMFQAVLHALEISGKSRTLSAPKVTTLNNANALIRIGEDFRYFEEYDVQSIPSSVTDAGTQVYSSVVLPVGSPTLEELGISLDVTPSVGADRSDIALRLVPEISEFVRYESYEVGAADSSNNGNNGVNNSSTNAIGSIIRVPIFRRSRIETEMIVRSGETVVMGGLISAAQTDREQGVPFLSSLPLVGNLFRSKVVDDTSQNLLIFVTATLLSESGDTLVPPVRTVN